MRGSIALLATCLAAAAGLRVLPLRRPVHTAGLAQGRVPAHWVRMQEVNLGETATAAIDNVLGMLGEDTEPPKGLVAVKAAVADGEKLKIGNAMYLLLVEQCLDYDVTEEGVMVPTVMDYSKTDDPKVREKMQYIYTYGISMFKKEFISQEDLMDAVLTKVASRVGMDGPAFDKWLEMPAAV